MSDTLFSPEVAEPCASQPFSTYAELMCRHRNLMQRFSSENDGETQLNNGIILDDIEQFVGRVAATGALLDDENERLECQGLVNYWTTRHCRLGGALLDLPLAAFDAESAPLLPDESYPYGRLAALQSCDSAKLFGCSRLLHESLVRLRDVGMLVLIGANGSGRSRFIDCVLIPALRNNETDGGKDWRIVPTFEPGDEPLERLASAILGLDADATSVKSAAQSMRDDDDALANLINQRQQPMLLVIDHFEQLFTQCAPETRLAMAANLYGAIREADPPCRVVIMLNRRYASHLSQLKVSEADWAAAELLFSFAPHEVREAIVEPAQAVGLKYDPGLIDRLVMDVQGDPAALSLLQFQLEHLWKARQRNRITWDAYRELGGGGLALERQAEQLYAQFDVKERSLVRDILLQMIQLDAVGDVSSQARRLSELGAGDPVVRDGVFSKLIAAGLVRRTPDGSDEDPQFNIAHDALITHWPRLTGWIEEMRVANRHRLQFHQQAEDWLTAGKPTDRLWRGLQLEEARQFKRLTPVERDFITAGRRRERLYALLRTAAIVAVALSIIIALWTSFLSARRDADSLLRQRMVEAIEDGDVAGAALLAAELPKEMVQETRAVLDAEAPSLVRTIAPKHFHVTAESQINRIGSMAITEPMSARGVGRRVYVTLRSDRQLATDRSNVFADSLGFFVADDAGGTVEEPVLYDFFRELNRAEAVAVRPFGPSSVIVACNLQSRSGGQKVARVMWCKDASRSVADFGPMSGLEHFPEGHRFEGADSVELGADCLLTITRDAGENRQLHAWCTGGERLHADVPLRPMRFQWPGGAADALEHVAQARLTRDGKWLMIVAAANTDDDKALEPRQLSWWKRDDDDDGDAWTAIEMPKGDFDRQNESSGWLPKQGDAKTPPCWERLDSHVLGLVIDQTRDEAREPECITCAHDGEVLFWSSGPPLVEGNRSTFQPTLNKRLDVGVSVYDAAVIDACLGGASDNTVMNHKVLATCGRDRTTRFWNVNDRDEMAPRMDHGATVERAIVLSPTGAIVTLADGFVRIWKVPTSLTPQLDVGENLATLGPRDREAVQPPTGNLSEPRDALFIDSDKALASRSPNLVAFDDAKPVAYTSADHQLFVKTRDQWTPLPPRSELCDARVKHLAYSTAKQLLVVSGSYDGGAANRLGFTSVYADGDKHVTTFHHDEEALYADFSDHDLLATCDVHNWVKIIDVSEKNREAPDDVDLKEVSLRANKPPNILAELSHSSDVTFASFAPNSERHSWRIATVSSDGEARLWDARRWTNKESAAQHVPVTLAHGAKVSTAEFDASGQFVVTASRDKTARIWRTETHGGLAASLVGVLRHPLPLDRAWFLDARTSRRSSATLPDIITVYGATASLPEGEATPTRRYFARRWSFVRPQTRDSAEGRADQLKRLAGRKFDRETHQLTLLSRDELLSEVAP